VVYVASLNTRKIGAVGREFRFAGSAQRPCIVNYALDRKNALIATIRTTTTVASTGIASYVLQALIRIKTDLGVSYGLARKKFEEQFDRQKETYARITRKNNELLQKELAAIKERQKNMKEITKKIERKNEELKKLTKRLIEARKT
jgi:hypothetical protein